MKKNKEEIDLLLETFVALVNVGVNIRGRLVEYGIIPLLHAYIKNSPEMQTTFLDCIKPFFTFSAHQRALLADGVLDTLIGKISAHGKNTTALQIKVLEVLLYFDGAFVCFS